MRCSPSQGSAPRSPSIARAKRRIDCPRLSGKTARPDSAPRAKAGPPVETRPARELPGRKARRELRQAKAAFLNTWVLAWLRTNSAVIPRQGPVWKTSRLGQPGSAPARKRVVCLKGRPQARVPPDLCRPGLPAWRTSPVWQQGGRPPAETLNSREGWIQGSRVRTYPRCDAVSGPNADRKRHDEAVAVGEPGDRGQAEKQDRHAADGRRRCSPWASHSG
jgi:hypothetical protein